MTTPDDQTLHRLLGRTLQDARKARGLTQAALAQQVGCSTSHLAHVEAGEFGMSVGLLVRITDALGVSVDRVLALAAAHK
jgi:transcriptional regulator with XRE-family HTH domain